MKIIGILLFMFTSYISIAQEIRAVEEQRSPFLIQRIEIQPSLTNLAPEIPNTGRFKIREVNFDDTSTRREVNIGAVLEREKQFKRRMVELAPPVRVPQDNSAEVDSDRVRFTPNVYSPAYNPFTPARGTQNSVYRDASFNTGAHLYRFGNPYHMRGFYY